MIEGLTYALTLAEWHSDFWTPEWPDVAVGALYIAASLWALVLLASRASRSPERRLWSLITGTVIAVSFVVLAGLPDYVTDVMRAWVSVCGWYGERWPFQLGTVVGLCTCAVVAAVVLHSNYPLARPFRHVMACLSLLAVFVLIRAVSLHEIDALLRINVCGGLSVSRTVEGGLLLALLGAMRGT